MFFQPLLADDESFTATINRLKALYFPSNLYNAQVGNDDDVVAALDELAKTNYKKSFNHLDDLDNRQEILEEWKKDHLDRISKQANYTCLSSTQHFRLPLTDHLHRYFLRRKYTYPPMNNNIDMKRYMFSIDTYSATVDDFNHFGNVFAVVSRLIQYFSEASNVEPLMAYSPPLGEVVAGDLRYHFDNKSGRLSFNEDRGRVFRLLVATFYHDIGKTIIKDRHALEGAILIAFDTEEFLPAFSGIFASSGAIFDRMTKKSLDRDDVILIEDLVHYHDVFGTLATGETGYIRLINVIECLRRYAQKYTFDASATTDRSEALAKQVQWSRRCLFDLWVLNVADILTSMPGLTGYKKGEEQVELLWGTEKWRKVVADFLLNNPHGINLRHDLMLSLNLITRHAQKIHADDNAELTDAAREYSSRHAIERIRRLVYATIMEVVTREKEKKNEREGDKLVDAICDEMARQWRIQSVINRFVGSCMDVGQFANNMTWIGQLDYALPFFRILADEVVKEARSVLIQKDRNSQKQSDDEIRMAGKVIEDYVSVVVQIIRHILVRELHFQRVRNIEFATARDRLEPSRENEVTSREKVRRVLGYHGSYKQQRAIDLVLGSIFVW